MERWFHLFSHAVSTTLELIAIVIIALGSLGAAIDTVRALVRPAPGIDKRRVWLRYAQWLVLALTFQLGADIVGTTLDPSWQRLGRLAAIAALRTFLTFTLDRDVERIRLEQKGARDVR